MTLQELGQLANMLPQLIYIIKFFGTIIVLLLSVIATMGGIIWNNLRKEIKSNKEEAERALREHKEDGKDNCAVCYRANEKAHEEIWDAIEICCPRSK